uniref:NADH dehydrogenase subunit 4L n=1 Tax=Cacopsylla melanoneura TaxID=428564 RepID=A0A8D8VFQ7_9HEMI
MLLVALFAGLIMSLMGAALAFELSFSLEILLLKLIGTVEGICFSNLLEPSFFFFFSFLVANVSPVDSTHISSFLFCFVFFSLDTLPPESLVFSTFTLISDLLIFLLFILTSFLHCKHNNSRAVTLYFPFLFTLGLDLNW